MTKLYRVEVVKSKDPLYPHTVIQLLYTYDGYFFGSLCGKTLLDAETVPQEFLDGPDQSWRSKFKNYIKVSQGGDAPDELFNRVDGTIDHCHVKQISG